MNFGTRDTAAIGLRFEIAEGGSVCPEETRRSRGLPLLHPDLPAVQPNNRMHRSQGSLLARTARIERRKTGRVSITSGIEGKRESGRRFRSHSQLDRMRGRVGKHNSGWVSESGDRACGIRGALARLHTIRKLTLHEHVKIGGVADLLIKPWPEVAKGFWARKPNKTKEHLAHKRVCRHEPSNNPRRQ